ncbi:MAG: LuxR C-terminal-related transcriptional regulator [Candidatus Acidiferrum sp.]
MGPLPACQKSIALQRRLPSALFDSSDTAGPLLSTLFVSPVVGVAVLDSQMRFRAINAPLATMNGMPATRHAGRKLRDVLGGAATTVECAADQVIQSGRPVSLDLTATLPLRSRQGHWFESFFPIPDVKGRAAHVAAVVLEITEKKNLERSLNHMMGNLSYLLARLKTQAECYGRMCGSCGERSELLRRTIELAQSCVADAQALYTIPRLDSPTDAAQRPPLDFDDLGPHSGTSTSGVDKCGRHEVDCARKLSPRERSVLQLLATGQSNKEVGATLGISVRTAEYYRARLIKKVELRSLADLVRFAVRNKIVEA